MIPELLAHYRIQEKLGAGGMGEVYRARDTKLGRDVAIKLLPDLFSRDPERLARFEREAQLLAALNHPNIAAIYGLEESAGTRFLVLELVPGETLAARIAAGPLPLEEIIPLALQLADALEAAHERGIIHRDLKPANLKITPEGKLKVLDFGLAKDFAATGTASDLSQSPTLTALPGGTRAGVVLGTAAYMSPEQACGKPLDRRTDIWSFGCVLFEMITGKHPFSGGTTSDLMAAILRAEPDWNALPAPTPERIRVLLRRCLEKDPRHRLRDIGDARFELEAALAEPAAAMPQSAADAALVAAALSRARWRKALPWSITSLMALVAIGAYWAGHRAVPGSQPNQEIRFSQMISLPQITTYAFTLPALAFSPDGTRIVYAMVEGDSSQLYVRALNQLEGTSIANTTGASSPFFSPDGRWIAFFARGKLMKVSLSGGLPTAICDAPGHRGGDWGEDETVILVSAPDSAILRVPSSGGAPQQVTTLDTTKGENSHRWPRILPGGKAIIFTVKTEKSSTYDDTLIAVQELGSNVHRVIAEGGSDARYIPSGHIVYARAGTLQAIPFDLRTLKTTGPAATVLERVASSPSLGWAHYTVSATGSLAYVAGDSADRESTVVWVDRKGKVIPTAMPKRRYQDIRLAPDGKHIAVQIAAANENLWISEIERGNMMRLTTATGNNEFPVWTPDGKRVAFRSDRISGRSIYWKLADGTGAEEALVRFPAGLSIFATANSFSPDGKWLVYTDIDPATGRDLWLLPVTGDRKPQPLLRTPFNEHAGVVSPDGKWISYTSNESGRNEVYVQPFPGPGGKVQVSLDGGGAARWAHNRRELFYRNGNKMMVVTYTTSPTFSPQPPKLLFEGNFVAGLNYEVSPDDQRFAMLRFDEQEKTPLQLNVVVNWSEEVKRRVPGGKN